VAMSQACLIAATSLLLPPAMILLFSRVGGWHRLAEVYPGGDHQPPTRTRLGFGVFRGWIGYNGALIVGSDSRGFSLRSWPVLLSWCHGPIFIPWSEVREVRPVPGLGGPRHGLFTRRAPEVDFALAARTYALVAADARGAGVPGAT
jgi:hypothetical protein